MALKVHKLTKKEAQQISNHYNLGKVIAIKLFGEGLVNSNYKLETDKDIYVIRFLGKNLDKWYMDSLKLERKVLFHLNKKNFPYEIPVPLQNKNKKYLSKSKGGHYWVYKMIQGESVKKLNDKQLKEVSKAVAIYYKCIKSLNVKVKREFFTMWWFLKQYKIIEKKLSKIKNPNKLDKLVKDNFEFFNNLVHKLDKMDFRINMIPVHGDIHAPNILFKGDKLIGIIDFDNIKIAPRVEDVAYTLRLSAVGRKGFDKKRASIFLKEYEKLVKLTKKEKSFIIPLMIRANCIVFWWMYLEMAKGKDKKYGMMKWTVDVTKALAKEFK
jgi:Ser/Thr protein kinase RdoA (MazF antagonist)